jgi:hypothetical protein
MMCLGSEEHDMRKEYSRLFDFSISSIHSFMQYAVEKEGVRGQDRGEEDYELMMRDESSNDNASHFHIFPLDFTLCQPRKKALGSSRMDVIRDNEPRTTREWFAINRVKVTLVPFHSFADRCVSKLNVVVSCYVQTRALSVLSNLDPLC